MDESITPDVVEAIADAKSVKPHNVDINLQNHIEMDAVDRLARHPTATWTVAFELPNHSVTITSDGLISIDGKPERIWL